MQITRDPAAQQLPRQVLGDSLINNFFKKLISIQLFTDFNKASYKIQYVENTL